MNNFLFDYDFLDKLMNYHQREMYARITLLTWDELPIKYIEGRVTGGSINVDGNSALRRTCNLTMILKDQSEINQFNWTFKSKFKLEIGIKNFINNIYPDIIWFKQGVFILTTCNMSQSVNNYTITINGKDKMCLLNGDLGGVIPHSTDFGVEEYLNKETGEITYNKLLLKDIIRNSVQTFGGELLENIIINDLDEAGLELLEYRYENAPLYLFKNINTEYVTQMTLNGKHKVLVDGKEVEIQDEKKIIYIKTSELKNSNIIPTTITLKEEQSKNKYNIIRLEYGDLAGYRLTDLVYAGNLTSNIGESLTSILDKIKNMLDNFEYFYNLDGKFVFQKKRMYVSTPWSGTENQESFVDAAINDSFPKINLMNSKLVTAFANNPNLLNVKNDFSVWGTYKTVTGVDTPIHMRYALDHKPNKYWAIRSIWTRKSNSTEKPPKEYLYFKDKLIDEKWNREDGVKMISSYFKVPFTTDNNKQDQMNVDWREILYQMALDYYALGNEEDFRFKIAEKNPQYLQGRTGYEQYYVDLEGFWRYLYDPNPDDYYEEVNIEFANQNKNTIYVQNYYDLIEDIEDLTSPDNLEKYSADDLYIIQQINTYNSENKEIKKEVFYPFIGSKKCCLKEKKDYWYIDGINKKSTQNKDILNKLSLNNIYVDESCTETVIDRALKEICNNYDGKTIWVKRNKEIQFEQLEDKCKIIYCGGVSATDKLVERMYRWKPIDNYGSLPYETSLEEDKEFVNEISERITYVQLTKNKDYNNNHWNKMIEESPNSLIFWFDFLDAEGSDLYKYSVKEIGSRTKSINDSNVKSIYYREVPNIIFQSPQDKEYPIQTGYTYINLPVEFQTLFSISGRGKSAKERIDELLQDHSYIIEQANITTIPLYHLEPNTRILVQDEKSNINGEYIVSKMSIPLTYNGTMTLTTTKVVSNIM